MPWPRLLGRFKFPGHSCWGDANSLAMLLKSHECIGQGHWEATTTLPIVVRDMNSLAKVPGELQIPQSWTLETSRNHGQGICCHPAAGDPRMGPFLVQTLQIPYSSQFLCPLTRFSVCIGLLLPVGFRVYAIFLHFKNVSRPCRKLQNAKYTHLLMGEKKLQKKPRPLTSLCLSLILELLCHPEQNNAKRSDENEIYKMFIELYHSNLVYKLRLCL